MEKGVKWFEKWKMCEQIFVTILIFQSMNEYVRKCVVKSKCERSHGVTVYGAMWLTKHESSREHMFTSVNMSHISNA